ncbi:MAG: transposase [Actinomycetota bacterium]|nr:transposase [Actinomycetota bacterium]
MDDQSSPTKPPTPTVFGLFWLLGYQFSPRPAGLPDQRFWRLDRDADHGPLNGLARNRINPQLIITHWDTSSASSDRSPPAPSA